MIAAGLAALVATVPAPAVPVVRVPTMPRYALTLRWSPARATLSGSERITFRNNGATPLSAVWLRYWPNGWHPVGTTHGATGCTRPRAWLRVTGGGTLGKRAASCTAFRVDLAAPVTPGGETTIGVTFATRVPHADDRFGTSGAITFLGNAVPVLAVRDDRGWQLPAYSAYGESFFTVAASWDARIALPAGVTLASTGAGTRHRGVWHVKATNARDFALAVGNLQVDTSTVDGVRVRVLTPRGTAIGIRRHVAAWTRTALQTYAARWGPYGAAELDVVTGAFTAFGGMEYPEVVFTDPFEQPVVHEVAHQWFYRIVGNDQWTDPWLDESFASYAERLVAPGATCSTPSVPALARLSDSMAVFDARPAAYYAVVYLGGACALETLERGLGKQAFSAFLRRWVVDHRFGIATTADFIAAVRVTAPSSFSVDGWLADSRLPTG